MSGPRKPRKGLTRKAPLSRSWIKPSRPTKPKASNPARKVREFARAYHSKERVRFVKAMPCVAASTFCDPTRENAHIATGGMGRKADADMIVPMCNYHHRLMHGEGQAWFQASYHVDLLRCAMNTEKAWQAHCQEAA